MRKNIKTLKELDLARYIVENTNKNLFLTGKAGTGKTTFLQDLDASTRKKHIILAPTGLAAINAGGMTIHSFFRFPSGPYVKGSFELKLKFTSIVQKENKRLELIRQLELLIIDEVSMVRADLMDHINDELQRIRGNNKPFGGVQMLMLGDLYQLPPIEDEKKHNITPTTYPSIHFFNSSCLRNSEYFCIELTKVYRQTNKHFVTILNRARIGKLRDCDLDELNERYLPSYKPPKGENYIRLVTHNYQVNKINNRELDSLKPQKHIFKATISGKFPKKSLPAEMCLCIKKQTPVMFVKNDPEKRFANGTLGIVKSITDGCIRVKLSNSGESIDVKPVEWKNIQYEFDTKTKKIRRNPIGLFKQFPLKIAWAITIHKCQGLTFDKAIIDINRVFVPGQAYVALSRCRTIQGLVLTSKVNRSNFITNDYVEKYLKKTIRNNNDLANTVKYPIDNYNLNTVSEEVQSRKISFDLYQSGKTVLEIAKERHLKENTILKHLSFFVASKELDVHSFISEDCLKKVEKYLRENPNTPSLKSIFLYFNKTVSYEEIRMALAFLK